MFVCFCTKFYFCLSLFLSVPSEVTGVSLFREVKEARPILFVNWSSFSLEDCISMDIYKLEVQIKKNSTATWNKRPILVPCNETFTTITRLGAGNSYNIRVRVMFSDGHMHGPWSDLQTASTYASELMLLWMTK